MSADDKFQLIHPDGKPAPRIDKAKYELVRAALLTIIPQNEEGVPFTTLAERVAASLSREQVSKLGSMGWYTTEVKLDMEARGEIERVPGSKPQRLRRKDSAAS